MAVEMSQYSVASEDRLLTTAQCGDQQAFIELCGMLQQ